MPSGECHTEGHFVRPRRRVSVVLELEAYNLVTALDALPSEIRAHIVLMREGSVLVPATTDPLAAGA